MVFVYYKNSTMVKWSLQTVTLVIIIGTIKRFIKFLGNMVLSNMAVQDLSFINISLQSTFQVILVRFFSTLLGACKLPVRICQAIDFIFVFNVGSYFPGDLVDRGANSCEIVLIVLCYMILYVHQHLLTSSYIISSYIISSTILLLSSVLNIYTIFHLETPLLL